MTIHCIIILHIVTYDVRIITFPIANSIPGSNNTLAYFTDTNLTLICLVTPTPPVDSQFNWNCSTGCFADMEMERTIQVDDLEEMDSGILSCSVFINGMEYASEPVELVIIECKNVCCVYCFVIQLKLYIIILVFELLFVILLLACTCVPTYVSSKYK